MGCTPREILVRAQDCRKVYACQAKTMGCEQGADREEAKSACEGEARSEAGIAWVTDDQCKVKVRIVWRVLPQFFGG